MGALQQGLSAAWSAVATFVPKLVVFLIILLVGWLIAKAVSKAVQMAFNKMGFNKLLAKSGLNDMTSATCTSARPKTEARVRTRATS